MGNWHAQDGGEKERRVQQQEKPSGGEGVARSATEGLSNKGLQSILPGLSVQLKGMGGAVLDDTIASAIHNKRGSGESLDSSAAKSIGGSMGQDFSDVNIHRDAESDTLNKQVQAEAFTTGKDIFFREGKYDPVSNEGQKLLAHELTHVVQQRDAPPASELKVSDPNEASEQQAHSVADAVTAPKGSSAAASGAASVGRLEEDSGVDRQAMMHGEDEEKEGQGETNMAMQAARDEAPEQEEEQASTQVARDEAPEQEEEQAATQVARNEAPEQEEEQAATQVARNEAPEQEEEQAATQVARDEAPEQEEEQASAQVARHESEDDHAGHAHA
jgi:hypothetical protein